MMNKCSILMLLCVGYVQYVAAQVADTVTYLAVVKTALQKQWPNNSTINLVFHGHSVPSGYFRTPDVKTLESYPHLVLKGVKTEYPYAVVNAITTSIGGENSEQGEKRFEEDVLTHRPDVVFIDYALNDRGIGLERSRTAMEKMIRKAQQRNIPVILLTPSPDLHLDILQKDNLLAQYTRILVELAKKYKTGLADSYAAFVAVAGRGQPLEELMATGNHPNQKGHALIARGILSYFSPDKK